ncbi:MAG: hypothetical protein ACU833_00850 [Gammaproteobacteria bacterium]
MKKVKKSLPSRGYVVIFHGILGVSLFLSLAAWELVKLPLKAKDEGSRCIIDRRGRRLGRPYVTGIFRHRRAGVHSGFFCTLREFSFCCGIWRERLGREPRISFSS